MKFIYTMPLIMSFFMFACSEQNIESNINTNETESSMNEFMPNDSLLPYFEFNADGKREHFSDVKTLSKRKSREILVIDSVEVFQNLEEKVANRLANDYEYSKSIERPLDYVCPISLLALNEEYESISLKDGTILLNDSILYENCEYVGFECGDSCDEYSEEDPYLKSPKALLKQTVENKNFDSEVTVEIYPYRMIASSFVTGVKLIYASAGSETYFKKRQRVWRGTKGMVWRWADFDPDRNGIRSYCFSKCSITFDPRVRDANQVECDKIKAETDLDTWGDTEDITIRCKLQLAVGAAKIKYKTDFEGTDKVSSSLSKFKYVKEYTGAVIGTHYVRHGDNYFKAMTSYGVSKEDAEILARYKNVTYR